MRFVGIMPCVIFLYYRRKVIFLRGGGNKCYDFQCVNCALPPGWLSYSYRRYKFYIFSS